MADFVRVLRHLHQAPEQERNVDGFRVPRREELDRQSGFERDGQAQPATREAAGQPPSSLSSNRNVASEAKEHRDRFLRSERHDRATIGPAAETSRSTPGCSLAAAAVH